MCQMWALLGAIHTGFGKPPAAYRKPTTTLELQPYPPSLKMWNRGTPTPLLVCGGGGIQPWFSLLFGVHSGATLDSDFDCRLLMFRLMAQRVAVLNRLMATSLSEQGKNTRLLFVNYLPPFSIF